MDELSVYFRLVVLKLVTGQQYKSRKSVLSTIPFTDLPDH
jgi:hypothetical protein